MLRVSVSAGLFEQHLTTGARLRPVTVERGIPEGYVLHSAEWNWEHRVVELYFRPLVARGDVSSVEDVTVVLRTEAERE